MAQRQSFLQIMLEQGLWVVTMCQYSFINCNKCTILIGGVDGRGCAHVALGVYGNLCLPLNFCHEPNTALKKSQNMVAMAHIGQNLT